MKEKENNSLDNNKIENEKNNLSKYSDKSKSKIGIFNGVGISSKSKFLEEQIHVDETINNEITANETFNESFSTENRVINISSSEQKKNVKIKAMHVIYFFGFIIILIFTLLTLIF